MRKHINQRDQNRLVNEVESEAVPAYESQRLFQKLRLDPASQSLEPAETLKNARRCYADENGAEPRKQRHIIIRPRRYG